MQSCCLLFQRQRSSRKCTITIEGLLIITTLITFPRLIATFTVIVLTGVITGIVRIIVTCVIITAAGIMQGIVFSAF